jgi:hypothetical protein
MIEDSGNWWDLGHRTHSTRFDSIQLIHMSAPRFRESLFFKPAPPADKLKHVPPSKRLPARVSIRKISQASATLYNATSFPQARSASGLL